MLSSLISTLKTKVLKTVEKAGFEVFRVKFGDSSSAYQVVRPRASYSPWNMDSLFMETFQLIRSHTLVDIYRCFELWQLVEQVKDLPGSIIEVGVWKGGTGAILCAAAKHNRMQTDVFLCDTFTGVVKADETKEGSYRGGEHADTSPEIVKKLLSRCHLDNAKILVGTFPEDTSHLIENERFRLCHIDVDVYQSLKDSFEFLWPRLSVGGLIVVDDYGFVGCEGTTNFVNELRSRGDLCVLHNLNGHAVIVKHNGVLSAHEANSLGKVA